MKRVLNKLIQEINETNYPIEVYTLTKLFHSILNISNKYHTEIMTNDEFLKENIENISRNILDNNINGIKEGNKLFIHSEKENLILSMIS